MVAGRVEARTQVLTRCHCLPLRNGIPRALPLANFRLALGVMDNTNDRGQRRSGFDATLTKSDTSVEVVAPEVHATARAQPQMLNDLTDLVAGIVFASNLILTLLFDEDVHRHGETQKYGAGGLKSYCVLSLNKLARTWKI